MRHAIETLNVSKVAAKKSVDKKSEEKKDGKPEELKDDDKKEDGKKEEDKEKPKEPEKKSVCTVDVASIVICLWPVIPTTIKTLNVPIENH